MSKEPGVIALDTRSTFRFDRLHVKGARHLNFSDFTQNNLKKVIPSFETKILIYCNNSFDGNQTDFASKVSLPRPKTGNALATELAPGNGATGIDPSPGQDAQGQPQPAGAEARPAQ